MWGRARCRPAGAPPQRCSFGASCLLASSSIRCRAAGRQQEKQWSTAGFVRAHHQGTAHELCTAAVCYSLSEKQLERSRTAQMLQPPFHRLSWQRSPNWHPQLPVLLQMTSSTYLPTGRCRRTNQSATASPPPRWATQWRGAAGRWALLARRQCAPWTWLAPARLPGSRAWRTRGGKAEAGRCGHSA